MPWLDTRASFVARTRQAGTLLDLGSSDGETLRHIAELRPDLRLRSVDISGNPQAYPSGCDFHQANLEKDVLPWPAGSVDAVTCMHLVEHLRDQEHLMREIARLLAPGGSAYIETPHPKTVTLSSPRGAAAGMFTMNFYDDPTHVRPVSVGALAQAGRALGLQVLASGTSRNLIFASSWPIFLFLPSSRKKLTSFAHWLGWSAYIILRKS